MGYKMGYKRSKTAVYHIVFNKFLCEYSLLLAEPAFFPYLAQYCGTILRRLDHLGGYTIVSREKGLFFCANQKSGNNPLPHLMRTSCEVAFKE